MFILAIDDNCMLTPMIGLKMAEFPLHPMYAKMLLSSGEFGFNLLEYFCHKPAN